jgi:GntR family transcriptional regulator/MocR family aminotransferase
LAELALDKGIIIEPGEVHFISLPTPKNCFRLGFSAVPSEDIEPGIILLAELISTL